MLNRRNFLKVSAMSTLLATTGMPVKAGKQIKTIIPDTENALEKEKQIPIIAETDILVVGGTVAAVAAAVAAATAGKKVYLLAQMPYLGDDICGTCNYEKGEPCIETPSLIQKIFVGKELPLPLHVKTELENQLIFNEIPFLYSTYVTELIINEKKQITGAVIVNRSGRQAIKTNTIIDATQHATIARLAEIKMTPFVPGPIDVTFVTIGNNPPLNTPQITKSRIHPQQMNTPTGKYALIEYTLQINWTKDDYQNYIKAEQTARNQTWHYDIVDSADLINTTPRRQIITEQQLTTIPRKKNKLDPRIFTQQTHPNLWILNQYANIDRKIVKQLFTPVNAAMLGTYVGECAANNTEPKTINNNQLLPHNTPKPSDYGTIKELNTPLRHNQEQKYITTPQHTLPILAKCDVVISGGGTAGAPAAIAAARNGAKTLVVEYLHALGGLGTVGMIGIYWDGYRGGFTQEIDEGVRQMAPAEHPRQKQDTSRWDSQWKAEWYRKELLKAGGELWYGTLTCGALIEKNTVKGIIIATPFGRGIILANTIIDSSGSADVAIAAGAAYEYTGAKTVTIQGAGLSKMNPTDSYNNNDWLFIDDTDIIDVTKVYVQGKEKYKGQYDLAKIPQTRERRRIVGEYTVTVADIIQKRKFADVISYHLSSFDTHGTTIDPYFTLNPPQPRHITYDAAVPLRSLLPKNMEGIIVTGLGTSAHRDAMPVIRMQPCLQSQGYAVGYLAAQKTKQKQPIRKINLRKIQEHLVQIGNLPPQQIVKHDTNPYDTKTLKKTVDKVAENWQGLDILLEKPEISIPLLQEKIKHQQTQAQKLPYASILTILGRKEYANIIAQQIQKYEKWDEGWNYTGMGQFGKSMSILDALIITLGNAQDENHLSVILQKAEKLEPEDNYSHIRAIAIACENIKSPQAAPILWQLLNKPGMKGHHIPNYKIARNQVVPNPDDVEQRNKTLKEFHLARALYRCGDKDNLGRKILHNYAESLEGHYARAANQILHEK